MGSAVSRPATLKVSQDQDTTTTLPREVVHLSPRAPQTPVGQVYHRLTDQEFRDVIPAPRPHRAPAVQNPRRNLTLFSPVPPRAESLSSSTIRGIRVRLFNSPSSSAQESSLPEPNDSFTQALPDDREEDGFIPAIMENTRPLSGDDSEQALSDDKEEDGFIPATMENIRLFSREDCDDDHDSSGSLHVRTKHNKTTALQTIKGKLGEEEPLTVAHYAVTASASDAEMPYFYAQLVLDQNQYTHQWSFTVRLPTQLQPDESADWLIPVSENRIEIALDELIRRQYTRHARDILFFLNQKEERDWRRLRYVASSCTITACL